MLTGPVDLRGRRAPSRVLFGPHETNLGDAGRGITERHAAYYARRAAGGAGLIVVEPASVHPSDHPYAYAPAASAAARGWAAVARACRPHGTLVLAGLAHAGGQGSSAHSRHPLWAPSAVPDAVSRETPVAMGPAEIDAVVRGFADAARSAVDSGVDGVEIQAGQHSVLRQFCSGLTNHRTDGYGTDRPRLLREVLDAVRDAVGPDPVLAVRLCVDELAPWAGITPADGTTLACAVAGTVDLLVPVVGSGLSVGATRPDLHTPEAFLRPRCAEVRRARAGAGAGAGAAMIVLAGSVASPWLAQDALSSGDADIVEMTRAQIADPDLVSLARAGTPERIRPCTLSNALAAARDPRNPVVGDELEPRSGYETTEPPVAPPASVIDDPVAGAVTGGRVHRPIGDHRGGPRTVLVVGGGPAGLEAARTLAVRGHRVTLHERAGRLGGLLHAAAALPGRSRTALPVAWWERELDRLGVRVELGSELDAGATAAAEARGAAVLLATGSRPSPVPYPADVPVWPAAELAAAVAGHDRDVRSVLTAAGVPGGAPVLVRDPLGDWTGPGVAELLAAAGYPVTLATPDAVAGHQLGRCGDLAPANARLERAGVVRAVFTELRGVAGGVAELADVHTGASTRLRCGAVVDCGARLPDRSVPDGPGRVSAGDRVAPRTLADAVREGRRRALALDGAPPASGPTVVWGRPAVPPGEADGGAPPGARGPRGRRGPAATLGTPLRRGRHELRNRIVFTAHLTGYAEGGMPTARHAAYYAARAAGGAGLVITEEHAVLPDDRPYERLIRGHDPAVLPGYRMITDAVHAHGAVVLAQLNHNGAQGTGIYSREPVRGPSALPDPMFREMPAELDADGIAEIVAGFADVAARCVAGGFDGVELQCSHASLLRLFLSPATNRRTDDWGGDRARRARLVLDVVAAVRAAIGPGPVLGVRIGADERIAGGITPGDGADLARRLAATGAVDHLTTSIGVATSTLHLIEPSMHTPSGYAGHLAATLRRAVRGADLPVIGVGRFTTPQQAAGALTRGECDLVGVARGQIADPEFASRALAGRPVRRCVGCNQDCIGRVGLNLPLACAVNPEAGREPAPGTAPPTGTHRVPRTGDRGRRVLVAGAGPAGLAAAAALAGRGHHVLVADRAATPGGQLALAATAPGRSELGHVVEDLHRAAAGAGAEIRFGVPVDRAFVLAHAPDVVVDATGSAPAPPPWDRDGRTVAVHEVLAGGALPDGPVLVVDETGFHPATSVAELLAHRGHAVEIVTPALVVGQDLGLTLDREGFRRRAHAAGIRCTTDRAVLGVTRSGGRAVVDLLHHPTGRTERRTVAAVVAASSTVSRTDLSAELAAGPWPVHRIGDVVAPRRMDAAIREGAAVPERLTSWSSRPACPRTSRRGPGRGWPAP